MYRQGEEEDGCIAEWRKMERRRMEGKERSSRVMDGWGAGFCGCNAGV